MDDRTMRKEKKKREKKKVHLFVSLGFTLLSTAWSNVYHKTT